MHHEIDRYAHLESPVHSWDPALKIVGFGLLILSFTTFENLAFAALGLGISIFFVRLSNLTMGFVLGRLKPVFFFMVPFFLLLPLGGKFDESGSFSLTWTWSREALALLLTLRALSIVILVFPMLGTAPFHLSMKSLQDIGAPRMVVQTVLFTYRYLFVYLEQLRKMRVAMKSRGFRAGLNLRSFKVYSYQVGMLLVTSYEQTERTLSAMKSRGYDGTLRLLYQPRRVPSDWIKLGAIAMLAIMLITGDRIWLK